MRVQPKQLINQGKETGKKMNQTQINNTENMADAHSIF